MRKLPKVLLSAGHWSEDSGAVVYNENDHHPQDFFEHDITTKALTYVLGEMWYDTPTLAAQVIVVPQAPLQEKIKFVNFWSAKFGDNPHFAVELHCNAHTNPDARGIEGICYPGNGIGEEICDHIIGSVIRSVPDLPSRGVRDTEGLGRRLAWVHDTLPSSVVVEMGFLTNPEDRAILVEDRRLARLARGLASGIGDAMLYVARWS